MCVWGTQNGGLSVLIYIRLRMIPDKSSLLFFFFMFWAFFLLPWERERDFSSMVFLFCPLVVIISTSFSENDLQMRALRKTTLQIMRGFVAILKVSGFFRTLFSSVPRWPKNVEKKSITWRYWVGTQIDLWFYEPNFKHFSNGPKTLETEAKSA